MTSFVVATFGNDGWSLPLELLQLSVLGYVSSKPGSSRGRGARKEACTSMDFDQAPKSTNVYTMETIERVRRVCRFFLSAAACRAAGRFVKGDADIEGCAHKMPESASALWSMVSLTAAKTSRMFDVSVACVRLSNKTVSGLTVHVYTFVLGHKDRAARSMQAALFNDVHEETGQQTLTEGKGSNVPY